MSLTEHAPRIIPTPGCRFVARIDFQYGDHCFNAGAPFPHDALGLVEDQALQLWRSAHIDVAGAELPAAADVVSLPEPEPKPSHTKTRHRERR